MSSLLNPRRHQPLSGDPRTQDIIRKTIEFFETRGKQKLKHDEHERVWYADFIEFQKRERIFSTLMTPAGNGDAAGEPARWDTWRNCEFNEVLGFYGLGYWYTWQVSMLGLCPLWMSGNEALKKRTARLLREGGIFAFGLSEKEHGADLYASEMELRPDSVKGPGHALARGRKYYIGNANQAALVSTFGKRAGTGGAGAKPEFVFFAVDSQHEKYECVQNVVRSQNYVGEYALHDYPIAPADILSEGSEAWDAALNTINICKFNLGWAAIGSCTHAFYEALNHASHRRLFSHAVTDFSQVKQLFVDAYSRLRAMKAFASRASDYMRSASVDDRRYLLFNPIVKMKVTTQGEEVINALWDVIAAKGFEKNMYFETAAREIRGLPKLEGTVHVNMALIIKFMKNYFFHPKKFAPVPRRTDSSDDAFLFRQGPTKGLGKIQFHDYRTAYQAWRTPNVQILLAQISAFRRLLVFAGPSAEQTKDLDFLLILGELFTLSAYGQLILEHASLTAMSEDVVEQIFDVLVRDFSKFALQLYSKTSSTRLQQFLAKRLIRKPVPNSARFERVWSTEIAPLKDQYEMSP